MTDKKGAPRRFSTVREIMEHYVPDETKLSGTELGKRIARELLDEFRTGMGMQD